MVDHVLVPMDGSPLSKHALEVALEDYPDASVTVLHVVDPTEPGYSYPIDVDLDTEPLHGSEEWYDRARELAEELFEEAQAIADDHEVALDTETLVGSPGRAIVDYAEEAGVDRIVMGSHGRGAEARVLLGSVTESVAFRSPVTVTLVR